MSDVATTESARSLAKLMQGSLGLSVPVSRILVKGLSSDSRVVREGDLFVAIKGGKDDGAHYVRQAIQKGAVAIVAQEEMVLPDSIPFIRVADARWALSKLAYHFYGSPAEKLKTIGVTGTNGKTTLTYLLESILEANRKKVGVMGTINYRYAGHVEESSHTTPGPIEGYSFLSRMAEAGCQWAVMEVSSHALDQKRVDEISFDISIFTNLTRDHLDYHQTMDRYFESKKRLFTNLTRGCAVLNADDAQVSGLAKSLRHSVVTYGIQNDQADVRAEDIKLALTGSQFTVQTRHTSFRIESPLFGVYNVYNVLAAVTAGIYAEVPIPVIQQAIRLFKGVPGRMESVSCGQDFLVFVDYAHTDDGLKQVLSALRPHVKGHLLTVFGCGGCRDIAKRPKMGAIASEYSDWVFLTSDNPRDENPLSIIEEIKKGFPQDFKKYSTAPDRQKAIRQALLKARKGDVVLVAGKGHETVQVVGQEKFPYNDRKVIENILKGF